MTWGFNLLSNDVNNTVAAARAMLSAFSSYGPASRAGVILDTIEIGNEPDLYQRPNWTVSAYANQYVLLSFIVLRSIMPTMSFRWQQFAGQIVYQAGLRPKQAPRLLLGSFASSSNSSTEGFSPQTLLRTNILNGSYFGAFVDT